jgi:hypothetical protein
VTIVGGVALVGGGIALGIAYADAGSIESTQCVSIDGTFHCFPSAMSMVSDAQTLEGIGIGTIIAGAIIATGGATWFALSGGRVERHASGWRRLQFTAGGTRNGWSVGIGGAL